MLDLKKNDCRIRREGAAPVFAGLRHIAFNQLKAETSFNKGMPAKQKKAMRSTDYLEKVLKCIDFFMILPWLNTL